MSDKKRKILYLGIIVLLFTSLLYLFSGSILTLLGKFLVCDEKPVPNDAIVVLSTGMEYYPRLIEAAELYRQRFAKKIVINGNRKTKVLHHLEQLGLEPCCPWYESSFRILELVGVPRKDMLAVSVEDAYDTVSEAKAVGSEIIKAGIKSIIVTTSKSHTRRASYIWKSLYKNRLKIITVAAKSDPFLPEGWWKSGRQIKWVLSEYGAFLYLLWKRSGWIGDHSVSKNNAVVLNSDGLPLKYKAK